MSVLKRIIAVCICLSVQQAMATAVDPADYVLIAYTLTSAQKAQFKTNDNAASAFWEADWSGRDYIDMNTTSNSYPGFDQWTGTDDAHMTVKAAADAQGLYVLMLIDDNVFIDPVGTDYRNDACDLYFDALSSEQIKSATPDIMVNPTYGWALTTSSQQFQVWMGAATVPRSLMYNFYDPTFFDFIIGNKVLFDDLPTLYKGMDIEVFRMSDTRKGQEWFIPWNYIGVTGIPAGTALAGRRIGFTGGYNDQDEVGGTEKILRWKQSDPFAATGAMETWGDLEMASDMPVVEGVNIRKDHGNMMHAVEKNGIVKTDLYDLRGVKLSSRKATGNGVLIGKQLLSDHRSARQLMLYSR